MAINPEESVPVVQSVPANPRGQGGNTLQDLLDETGQYLAPQEMERIERAYELANRAHMGVHRRSGEPYIQHPLEVALLLADMRIDADGIAAALLHDVVEDTMFSLEDIRKQFGDAVASIVDGVTKFDALVPSTSKDGQALDDEQRLQLAHEIKRRQRSETVRKMLLAMAEDPRVVVLKLADRLHNMRTLSVMNLAQQQNKARETSEIYAPLARRLGMALVQTELEDLALSYLEPENYSRIAQQVAEELRKRQPYIDEVCRILREEMERAGIHAEVVARQKHLASINRKLHLNGGEIDQVHDLVSYHILVDNDQDCYLALGHIHARWRPKDGRIKDFIATPKMNGYQSLHTTVFGIDNRLAEIQIRTHEMQRTADYGIASYWYLKERGGSGLSYHEMMAWIEQLRDWQRELPQSADEFVEAVKGDLFEEQIFVFTPKGDVKDLPKGSTPLDMAYRIHTDIGDHCDGARIITNLADSGRLVTRLVPLDYELQGGEIVDIVVNGAVHPTRDWLGFARTTTARTKIRRYLKTYEREINLQLGQERLDLALKMAGVPGIMVVQDEDVSSFATIKKYASLDDVLVAVGREDLPVEAVMGYLLPLLQSRGDVIPSLSAALQREREQEAGIDHAEASQDSAAQETQDEHDAQKTLPVSLAHCCYPIPGDAIVGLLQPGKGLSVHQSDCQTLRRSRRQAQDRMMEMNWLQIEPQSYRVPITIVAHDRPGLLRDVAAVVSDADINMTAVTSSTNASLHKAVITATLELESIEMLDRIFQRLRQVRNVVSVGRTTAKRSAAGRRSD
jgi:guanosine-3',5'-bis(diphosphate) 3'-pyrophosphohydrolase